MKLLSTLLLSALSATSADEVAKTSAVAVEFQGSSGGMKLFPMADEKSFIMIQQASLEERDSTGKKIKSLNVAGQNSWSKLATEVKDGKTIYSTTFSTTESAMSFALTAHLARETSTTTDNVACSACSGGTAGMCQKAADKACIDPVSAACPTDYTMCTEEVTVNNDQLKFSFLVSGWTFANPANTLNYALSLKSKGGGKEAKQADSGSKNKRITVDGGSVDTPTTAIIKGGTADKTVDVVVSTSVQGSASVIAFQFPSFAAGESLYYDPTLAVSGSQFLRPALALASGLVAACLFAL